MAKCILKCTIKTYKHVSAKLLMSKLQALSINIVDLYKNLSDETKM